MESMFIWIVSNATVVALGMAALVAFIVATVISVKAAKRVAFKKQVLGRLQALVPELQQLRSQLLSAEFSRKQALDRIVAFFDAVSRWQDRDAELAGIIADLTALNRKGCYDGLLHDLSILRHHFGNAGRCSCGLNRTRWGEIVTEDKVYLGDRWGLFTKTVSFWKGTADAPRDPNGWKGGWHDGEPYLVGKNAFDVVSDQAEEFMVSHIGPMVGLVNNIETATVC
jgi:hypothetical protein